MYISFFTEEVTELKVLEDDPSNAITTKTLTRNKSNQLNGDLDLKFFDKFLSKGLFISNLCNLNKVQVKKITMC